MNDQDCIRKAAELADGWSLKAGMNIDVGSTTFIKGPDIWISAMLSKPTHPILDALAAQLVRQVDALDNYGFVAWAGGDCDIREYFGTDNPLEAESILADADGPDRTMNTIKVVVDSGVLEA